MANINLLIIMDLRNTHLQNLTANFTINPFDNCTIVIDEAHNFVSRIVNKIKVTKVDYQ